MFEDKVLVCKDCGAEFVFTAGEQEFYAEKDSRMNPFAARLAVLPARISVAASVRCLMQFARNVESPQRFRSSPAMTDPFIAASASRSIRA